MSAGKVHSKNLTAVSISSNVIFMFSVILQEQKEQPFQIEKKNIWRKNVCKHAELLHSCPTLHNPMDCSLPGSSVHGILQARILKWVTKPSTGDLPDWGIQPMSLTSPALAGRFFTTSTTWESDLQCCINFWCIGKWLRYIEIDRDASICICSFPLWFVIRY